VFFEERLASKLTDDPHYQMSGNMLSIPRVATENNFIFALSLGTYLSQVFSSEAVQGSDRVSSKIIAL
jgi:hypothetical protein